MIELKGEFYIKSKDKWKIKIIIIKLKVISFLHTTAVVKILSPGDRSIPETETVSRCWLSEDFMIFHPQKFYYRDLWQDDGDENIVFVSLDIKENSLITNHFTQTSQSLGHDSKNLIILDHWDPSRHWTFDMFLFSEWKSWK